MTINEIRNDGFDIVCLYIKELNLKHPTWSVALIGKDPEKERWDISFEAYVMGDPVTANQAVRFQRDDETNAAYGREVNELFDTFTRIFEDSLKIYKRARIGC